MNKKLFKKKYNKCWFCQEKIYEILDVHRIEEGSRGGKYIPANCCVACSNCHRKIHVGIISDIQKFNSSCGEILTYKENNQEKISNIN